MAHALPFVRFITLPERTEPDALFGFSLPFLPDMLTSHWFTGVNEQERLHEALRLQVRLIQALWTGDSTVPTWDLRFVGTDDFVGVAIGLLCRLRRPPRIRTTQFRDFCLAYARHVQQVFADAGYELLPLSDERALSRYLTPFHFQNVAEIRRYEHVLLIESTYSEYEAYVTYPWHWAVQNRLRLFDTLIQRQSNCLVSVYLEPTQLTVQEQSHLNHATSRQMRDLLSDSGPKGEKVYNIYKDLAHSLHQPYLLRIGLAATTLQTLHQVGRMFLDELNAAQPLEQAQRVFLDETNTSLSGTGPILLFPQNVHEWQWACRSLANLECIPWGHNISMALPGSARLRSMVDARMASMAFRLPVTRLGDTPGVPVRSFAPSGGASPPGAPMPDQTVSTSTLAPTANAPTIRKAPPGTGEWSSIQKPEELIGRSLGSCQIEALLGRGGFGAVYRARQPHLGRQVAIKVVLAAIFDSASSERQKSTLRFAHEAQAVARLDHPHILALYEYQSNPFPYIVMPYMAHGSLGDEMQSSGRRPLPAHGVATILSQVASALDHAHQHHLVHRDVKPDNLLRHSDGRVLVSDFGIVQFDDNELTALTVKAEGSPLSPRYASPEQHQGNKVDYRSDIYSLGIVIYELLCGHRPFSQPHQHVYAPPPAMHSFGIQISPAIEAVVITALAKQPEQRHQSAGAFANEFQSALTR